MGNKEKMIRLLDEATQLPAEYCLGKTPSGNDLEEVTAYMARDLISKAYHIGFEDGRDYERHTTESAFSEVPEPLHNIAIYDEAFASMFPAAKLLDSLTIAVQEVEKARDTISDYERGYHADTD